MNILALDTTSEYGSLAVLTNGELRAQTQLVSTDGFSHLIFTAIQEILTQAQLPITSIDCFAAAAGPGSFTGVRVGLTAVKGLAEAANKRAAAISNLRALATFGSAEQRAVVLDARRGDVFAAVYHADGRILSPEVVTKLDAWLQQLGPFDGDFISTIDLPDRVYIQPSRFLASAVAACAKDEPWQDPASIDANYVRRSDAELAWRDSR